MTYKQYIRNVKLNDLGVQELSGKSLEIYNFINEHLIGLNRYKSNIIPDYILYGKDENNIVLLYNNKNKELDVHYKKIWSFFRHNLSMEYSDIQSFIQGYVVDILKIEVNYTYKITYTKVYCVVDTLQINKKNI